MRTIRTIAEMRAWLGNARAEGRTVGLVPTMGAFHAGHHSLMRVARAEQDSVVVSLFVNPAQFNDTRDLVAYPRTEANDAAEAAELGVDVLFAPPESEIYPDGFATTVQVAGLSEVLEGAERGPGHFAGVCTVVNKLLNIVGPDVAYFGAEGRAAGRGRQADGARPRHADADRGPADRPRGRRARAVLAQRAPLARRPRRVRSASRVPCERPATRSRVASAMRTASATPHSPNSATSTPEYLAIVDPLTFTPLHTVNGRTLVAVAAQVGPVRLIDNIVLEPVPVATG